LQGLSREASFEPGQLNRSVVTFFEWVSYRCSSFKDALGPCKPRLTRPDVKNDRMSGLA